MGKFRTFYLLISTITLGFLLRLYNLGKYDFWLDEVVTIYYSRKIWEMIKHFPTGATPTFDPPLFYLLLHFWSFLGKSEFILRLLPLSFGVLSIIAVYKVGQLLFNKRVGLISAFILALSPLSIYYSQELRPYSLVTFLTLMSIYNLVKSLENNRLLSWIGFIIFTVLCIYTHYVTVFLLIIIFFFFLYCYISYSKYKDLLKRWLISLSIILVLYSPAMMALLRRAPVWSFDAFPPKPSLSLIIQSFMYFNMGYNATATIHCLAVLLFLPLFLASVWFGLRQKKYRNGTYLLLFWLFVVITMVIIISVAMYSIYIDRVFLYSLPAYYILIAFGLSKIKKRSIYLCVLTLFIVFSSLSLKNHYQNIWPRVNFLNCKSHPGVIEKKEYRLAAEYIKNNFQNEDVIVHVSRATYPSFQYYHNKKLEQRWATLSDYKTAEMKGQDRRCQHTLSGLELFKNYTSVDVKQIVKGHSRIWLVYSSWSLDRFDNELYKKIKAWVDCNFTLMSTRKFYGITIYLYQITMG